MGVDGATSSVVAYPTIDIADSGIPTGTQTVQLIAGYAITQATLKGATKTTRVMIEAVSV
jgi:hypothetical protein